VIPHADSLKSHATLGEPGVKIILDALPLLPGQDDRDQPVSLEINGEHLTLKANGNAKNWTEIPIPATVSGLPVTISMNRTYLAKALKFGFTQIGIVDKTSPLVFNAKGRMFVVCPLGYQAPVKVPAPSPTPPTSPPENASAAATPPPAEPIPTAAEQPAERTQPVTDGNGAATAASGSLTTHPPESEATPAIDLMLAQIGTVRDGVKKALEDLGNTERLLRRAVKEHRANDKEINRARSTLRSLKSVEL
jgi:hypothetical protein